MLGTRERTLLLESLRPPAGYRLRRAVGTSFTLDLMALLTAPLAFTFFDAHDEDGAPVADPVALLEALRRHAEKITLFCQAGAIGVPRPDQKLLAYLEGSVIEVQPRREGGIFHPKALGAQLRIREGAGRLPGIVPFSQPDVRPGLGHLPSLGGPTRAAAARLFEEQAIRGFASGASGARYPPTDQGSSFERTLSGWLTR